MEMERRRSHNLYLDKDLVYSIIRHRQSIQMVRFIIVGGIYVGAAVKVLKKFKQREVPQKFKIELPYDPAVPFIKRK